jgi:hypothetical protein
MSISLHTELAAVEHAAEWQFLSAANYYYVA